MHNVISMKHRQFRNKAKMKPGNNIYVKQKS